MRIQSATTMEMTQRSPMRYSSIDKCVKRVVVDAYKVFTKKIKNEKYFSFCTTEYKFSWDVYQCYSIALFGKFYRAC